jgi:hypothetical protein
MARAMPPSVWRTSGSSVRLPAKLTLASGMLLPWRCLAGRSALPLDRYGHLYPEADRALRDRLDRFHEASGHAE